MKIENFFRKYLRNGGHFRFNTAILNAGMGRKHHKPATDGREAEETEEVENVWLM